MPPYVSHVDFSRLWQWLSKVAPYPNALAWCHTTDGMGLRSIIEAGSFKLKHCDVFDEDLLYFFYGRPAYRRAEDEQLRLSSKAPVSIVLSPDLIESGRRLFPFDTGAFEDRYKKKWIHPKMKLSDFELKCVPDAPRRHVSAFFKTNDNYLYIDQTHLTPIQPYAGEFEVESILELLRDPSTDYADDRRLAVELQLDKPLPFDASSVLGIIMPDELTYADWFDTYRRGPGARIEVMPYRLAVIKPAGHYLALLEEQAATLQRARSII